MRSEEHERHDQCQGVLIVEVSDNELELLRAVHGGNLLASGFDEQVVEGAVKRGLIDRVAGSYGGVELATPGRQTLWTHDRPHGLQTEPWEQCDACGSTNVKGHSAWQNADPVRADCLDCGYLWTATERGPA